VISKIVKHFIFSIILLIVGFVGFFWTSYLAIPLDIIPYQNYFPNLSSEILDRNGERVAYIFKGLTIDYMPTFDGGFPSFVIGGHLIATRRDYQIF